MVKGTIVFVAGLLMSSAAVAQHLQILGSDGAIVESARVMLVNDKGAALLLTDGGGRVVLPRDGYPYRINVASMKYREINDTIVAAWNKIMVVMPKMQQIDEVVVTGQYAPNSRENAVQKIEIIDRRKIDAMAAQNLKDVLTNQLNIRMSQDPIFGVSMSMMGSKSYGEQTKILIDGVPVIGKQNGSLDLAQINLANVERIEIIEGPMSVSYGTDALAGTINLITKKTQKHGVEAGATAYYETIGTYNVSVRAGFRSTKHTLLLNGGRNFFGGWNPADGPSFFDFKARTADTTRVQLWKPREQYMGGLQYLYGWNKTTLNYKFSYFNELITNRGMPQAPYLEQAFDDYYHTNRIDNVVNISTAIVEGMNINAFVAYNAYKRIKRRYATDLTTLDESPTAADQDTSRYNEVNSRGTLTTTNKERKINYEAGYDVNLQYANSTQLLGRAQDMGDYALFASAEYRPNTSFTIRPGVRYGYNTRYAAPLVPSVNVMYKAGTHWTVRGSYGKGFRKPNLKELYFDFVDINHDIHGNPNLKAEYSDNVSVSGVYSGKCRSVSYKVNGSLFYNNIKDLISLAMVAGGGANEYTYVNIGRYKTDGAQLSADLTVNSFSVSVGGSYIGTYNDLSETERVPQFSYSPEVRGSLSYNFKKQNITVSVFYKYTGRFMTYITDNSNKPMQVFAGGYNTGDVTIAKLFLKSRLNVAAGCKNLFDVTNILAYQAGGAHAAAGGSSAVNTGRYYFVKLDINLHN